MGDVVDAGISETYIELKKQFVASDSGPDSVRALYAFKEELEQTEDKQDKEVLMDVYDCRTSKGAPTTCSVKSRTATPV